MYRSWREVYILFLTPSKVNTFPPSPSIGGITLLPPPRGENIMMRN